MPVYQQVASRNRSNSFEGGKTLKKTLLNLKSSFMEYFKEREAEINGSLLALLSGENLLFLGPPGTAKTMLAKNICKSIEGGHFFSYLLTSFSTPEEIFGPLSLKALEEDEFRRNIDGYLPAAHIALLDEIFKASSAILNSLLTLLNERKFHNGKESVDAPLLSVFGASNELPEEDESLEALYDRFLFRYRLSYIQDDENFRALLFQSPEDFKPSARLSVAEVLELRKKAAEIPVDPEVEEIILELRKALQLQEIYISDRRWKKIIRVLKVAALASSSENKPQAVDRSMVLLLQHMLWNLPEERESIRKTVFELVVSGGINTEKLRKDAEDLKLAVNCALKNELPFGVVCDSCGEEFLLRQEIEAHHTLHPNHSYAFKKEGAARLYPYENLEKELDFFLENSGQKTISREQQEVLGQEIEDLALKVKSVKQRLEEERGLLKQLLNENIWLSALDRNEALLLQDSRSRDISEIEDEMQTLLPVLGPQDRPKKAEFQEPRGSVGDLMKGLGAKLGLQARFSHARDQK